ncbi:hypothetical protein KY382_35525 [Pseudomonas monteilii]|nr:hypothetical protein [Pseudomonas monteilii]
MDYLSFSKKEWEVLVCFWAVDEPLCCTEFSERFGLNRNTSLSVIRKLVNKMSGSVLARRFQPAVTELEILQSGLTEEQIFELVKIAIKKIEDPEQLTQLRNVIGELKTKAS